MCNVIARTGGGEGEGEGVEYILIYIDALSASLLIRAARKSTCFTRLAYNAAA